MNKIYFATIYLKFVDFPILLPSQENEGAVTKKIKEPSTCCYRFKIKVKGVVKAPVVIYFYNVVSYLVFLCILSWIILFGLDPARIEVLEVISWIWVFSYLVEEFYMVWAF